MKKLKRLLALVVGCAMMFSLGGCSSEVTYEETKRLTYDEATKELEAKLSTIEPIETKPTMYLYDDESTAKAIGDIEAFPVTVKGQGKIDIEIAGATELTAEMPDNLLNVWAEKFNAQGLTLNGQSVSVSVRKITSGEVLTYMTEGDYRPDVFIPSAFFWGEMLKSSGVNTVELTDRLVGNTAGILMKQEVYDDFIEKHDEVTVDKVVEACLADELEFITTNPYTSSTGENNLTAMLHCFDPANPLSEKATQKLIEYQEKSPSTAYTTRVLTTKASKGLVEAMTMEEQAYINDSELKDFVYTPTGVRHDHPVYTFDYVSRERQKVAQMFVDYCLSDEAQKLADERGFNRHDEYKGQDPGLDGAGYLAAQQLWKANKDAGKPIIAVFVGDVSISMNGESLNQLIEALNTTVSYIGSDNYIGLITYSDDVYVNLNPFPFDKDSGKTTDALKFDEKQRAYFAGAVHAMSPIGNTATYDAVLVGLEMIRRGKAEVPEAKTMLFLLSDGDRNVGYKLNKITDIVGGMKVPIYTIGYNLDRVGGDSAKAELQALSDINESVCIDANSATLINDLRNLFNTQL